MSAATERVAAALRAAGVEPQVHQFPQGTRTSQEAADAVGCDVAQIAKSIVFRLERPGKEAGALLVVASGANRVDVGKAAALAGGALSRADAAFVREQTGFAIGGVPAVGHARELPVLIDEELGAFDLVWSAAGTPNAVYPIAFETLVALTGGAVADVAER
jgi:prolyl-tRNA editing enzyme YbaK/EbsC (Cys-tRNA(Pro) deacylase)